MILVTGGTGFLGSYILRYLIREGNQVCALRRGTSRMDLVDDIKDQVEWIEGDINDLISLEDAFNNVTHVYHAAAMVSFDPRDSAQMMNVNVEGTANVVNQCLVSGVKKLLHVSSIAALGRTTFQTDIDEQTTWQSNNLNSKYAISKFRSECEVWRGIEEGLTAAIVNPSVILGSGFWNSGTCVLFKNVHDGLKFYPRGSTGFVDVRDVAKTSIAIMQSDSHSERYIINGSNKAFKYILDEIANHLKKKAPGIQVNKLLREIAWRVERLRSVLTGSTPIVTKETARNSYYQFKYGNKKISRFLDYNFIPIEETIKETCEQFLDSLDNNRGFNSLPLK